MHKQQWRPLRPLALQAGMHENWNTRESDMFSHFKRKDTVAPASTRSSVLANTRHKIAVLRRACDAKATAATKRGC